MNGFLSNSPLKRNRKALIADLVAGLTFAVVNVPQSMANALLATVNPVAGLYALMVAMPVGALLTSSVYMNVSTTGALSVAAGDALVGFEGEQKASALIALVLMIGAVQLILGLLKMGRMLRFVSHSVMTGFVTGIALLIVLGAVPNLTGYQSRFSGHFFRLADTLLNWRQIDPLTAVLGLATIGLIVGFGYTRWSKFSLILALGLVTVLSVVLSALFGGESLRLVGDVADIPRTLPRPMLPDLRVFPALFLPAFAIGIVGLVQGAGVGQSFPNPDGRFPDPSRDFAGQGLGNIAASFFEAIPCGGSMSGTAVSVQAGAQTRWANVAAGLFVIVIVLLFVDLVKLMPMAGLGGLLVVVGYQNLRPTEILTVWHTNRIARAAMVTTLLATLTMPLQFAILAGVAISFLLHVFRSSKQIEVVEFVPTQGFPIEQPAPAELTPEHVTVLHARGDLFFAAAANFEQGLPAVGQARRAVVIFNVRERAELGSTIIGILTRYARSLADNGGKLMLSGVSRSLREQLDRTGVTEILGSENLFTEQPQLGEALNAALTAARAWLQSPQPGTGEGPAV